MLLPARASIGLLLLCLGHASGSAAELVARRITVESAPEDLLAGSDAQGGIGDWALSNGIVRAIVDDVGFQQDILDATGGAVRLPITNGFAPSGGTLIDLGQVGRNDDQLVQVFQVVNFNAGTPIVYVPASLALGNPSLPAVVAEVDEGAGTARLTVFGFVFRPPISTPAAPTLQVTTVYSLQRSARHFSISTVITNAGQAPVDLFSIVDVVVLGRRANLPFAVAPGRGFKHPPLDLANPMPATGFFPFVTAVGRTADEVSYTVFSPDGPVVFGVNSDLVSALGNPPVTSPLNPGASRTYRRRVAVGPRNDVASGSDLVLAQLGAAFGFPTGTVRGQLVSTDGLPFRASVEITQLDMDPLTPEPDTLLTPLTGDRSPLPMSQVTTDSERYGEFEALLPAGLYELRVKAEERADLAAVPFSVPPVGEQTLPPIALAAAGRAVVRVLPAGPAKIVFKGRKGTPDPDFGVPVRLTMGGAPLDNTGDVASPAGNVVLTASGEAEVVLRPGSYTVYATRGIEHTVDKARLRVAAGQTRRATLRVERAVRPGDFLSLDAHVHSAASFDSSIPLEDRVLSFLAAGVQVLVSTEHDTIADYGPAIESLGAGDRIASIVGTEVTTGSEPTTVGHWNAFPLPFAAQARRRGAPEDEFRPPSVIFDSLRDLGASVVQLNHPESPTLGYLSGQGFDPGQPVTAPVNAFLLEPAFTGTGTRNLDFDTMEIYSTASIPQYLASRQDWFSLLDQGIIKAATAVSDSHRVVVEHAGFPRTYVASSHSLSEFELEEFNRNLKDLRAFGTSGPLIRLQAGKGGPGPGALVKPRPGGRLDLILRVTAAPWIPVEEIRVFANGELIRRLRVPRSDLLRRFAGRIPLRGLTADTWVVVEAGQELPADPTVQPASRGIMAVVAPGFASLAYTNPIFIDVDGNHRFDPPGVQATAAPTPAIRRALKEASADDEHWETAWPRLRMTRAQAERARQRLTPEVRRRLDAGAEPRP